MLRSISFASVAALAVALAGCKSSELSCELLADETNCWATAAVTLDDCVPDGEIGVLAVDRASCTYGDGTTVVFDDPLPTDSFGLERLGFTIEKDGTQCARFVDTFMNRMELTGDDGTAVAELHSGGDFHLHCPDGSSYASPFDDLFDCAVAGAPIPTDGFSVEADEFTFLITSIATPDAIITCTPSGT